MQVNLEQIIMVGLIITAVGIFVGSRLWILFRK